LLNHVFFTYGLYLHSVFLLEFKILFPQGVDTINHGLDKSDFGVAKTMLVRNVISVTSLSTRFTTGTTGLYTQYLTPQTQSYLTLCLSARVCVCLCYKDNRFILIFLLGERQYLILMINLFYHSFWYIHINYNHGV
jgi:hypothetical protein